MENLLTIIHVIACLGVIGLVLMQHGKGADMGAAFGSSGGGASGSLFGATGSANFLSRVTAIAATVFFIVTLGLAYMGNTASRGAQMPKSVMEQGPSSQIPGQSPSQSPAPAQGNPAASQQVPVAPANTPNNSPAPSNSVPVPTSEKTK